MLAAIALHGLSGCGATRSRARWTRAAPPRSHYARFLAITAVNPLTIASFAAVAAALPSTAPRPLAFVLGVGRRLGGLAPDPDARRGPRGALDYAGDPASLAIGGRVLVLAIAVHLASPEFTQIGGKWRSQV